MSSATGVILSYAIGIIFAVGGLLFMLFLDERRFLFGIPYMVIGVVLVAGVMRSQRRRPPSADDDGDDTPSH